MFVNYVIKIKSNFKKWSEEIKSDRAMARFNPRETLRSYSRKQSWKLPNQQSDDSPEKEESRESHPSSMRKQKTYSDHSSKMLSETQSHTHSMPKRNTLTSLDVFYTLETSMNPLRIRWMKKLMH